MGTSRNRRYTVFWRTFASLSALVISATVLLVAGFYHFMESSKRREYITRYEQLSAVIANSFQQMEGLAQRINDNAARVGREIEHRDGLLTEAYWGHLAQELGVGSVEIIDANGKFLRWSPKVPVENRKLGLFDFCPGYSGLVHGTSAYETTPMMPNSQGGLPSKFTMIPNHDGTRIIESTIDLSFVYEMLRSALDKDTDVAVIGLYAPNGKPLESVAVHKGAAAELPKFPADWTGVKQDGDFTYFGQKVPTTIKNCCECAYKGVMASGAEYHYMLRMAVSQTTLRHDLQKLKEQCWGILVLSITLAAVGAYFLSRSLVARLVCVGTTARVIIETGDTTRRVPALEGNDEINDLALVINQMLDSLQESRAKAIAAERMEALARAAGQVAHDIRSPLTALNVGLELFTGASEDARILMRGAIYRIQDIANDLLARNRAGYADSVPEGTMGTTMLMPLVEMLVSEKRTEYRSKLGVVIECTPGRGAFAFVHVDQSHLKRVLSNLLNNAVESIRETGSVVVSFTLVGDFVAVNIRDTGSGIPPDVLAKLGKTQVTHGKSDGNGLGVQGAHDAVAAMGGRITYRSELSRGTDVELLLPTASAPNWVVEAIDLTDVEKVVVVDDDVSIHRVWDERMGGLASNLELIHLSTPGQLQTFLETQGASGQALYLVDYEFLGHRTTGLDLIEELNLQKSAILVTSRFEESQVLGRCIELGLRLLPKPMAMHVPLQTASQKADAVLIDDDLMIHRAWKMTASMYGKSLVCFQRADDFLAGADGVAKSTPIYVDFELGENVKGEDVSRSIAQLGFRCVYLATGHPASKFGHLPWLKGVRDKSPPFGDNTPD